ncbi:NAD(P)/FAD-dependent oxidoreductase [Clostridium algidicarnis]|uniref:NAD(P)/FAD-dependent oxidoreductase n=1 Tax=Clostridium algidicarnis TaxID=37659 RepID=UPI001C0D173F|nr:NAD(P)/FAD-dependent oxidoreductase [Clostridium algidicarnis]MBU3203375.1 NAD(P)/FAD-dependent oxidoreductase [Clostridium algidicarnis]MBU3211529.1 NAD(P)/FAD-dependent oxidoreductase [Clostridium algidicarnis]MBU3221963.1 NAD(P)/FAD-dependent oxidoreductase [Clostridium algidicarnis]MCB2285761.1 NAD(P)/FAD-dependent oxidoreductase [Clostridium algidicarnis]
MKKVVVIGAGPAGLMAALKASENNIVYLIEANEKIGKKLYITGKGRCNVTNAKDISDFFDYIPGNPEFLYSSLYTFNNLDVMNYLESLGVPLKVERGDRVFPASDKSSDIIAAFNKELIQKNIKIILNSKVKDFLYTNKSITSVVLQSGEEIKADNFILCTGGVSYPQTGSSGDGYRFAKKLGHNIIKAKPSLVPIEIKEEWIKDLQGLSLKNVELSVIKNNKTIFKEFGEMIFTHYGISGPIVLTSSRYVNNKESYKIKIDLKPSLDISTLDNRVQKDFIKYINKDFKNALIDLLPSKLIDVIIMLSGISPEKKVNTITRDERRSLVNLLKNIEVNVKGLRSIDEAIVTAGGIDTKEIDASTMKSKIIDNLYFAGEVIDVDAFTGGYNVQIALSTGYLAGSKVGEV